jgi:hypothetical protein
MIRKAIEMSEMEDNERKEKENADIAVKIESIPKEEKKVEE